MGLLLFNWRSGTIRDRSRALRMDALRWAGLFLAPLLASAVSLVFLNHIPTLLRAIVIGTGLSLTVLVGWIGGSRLVTTL